jgi:hypothetical protein
VDVTHPGACVFLRQYQTSTGLASVTIWTGIAGDNIYVLVNVGLGLANPWVLAPELEGSLVLYPGDPGFDTWWGFPPNVNVPACFWSEALVPYPPNAVEFAFEIVP